MPPKKIIKKRKSSTEEQPTQTENMFQYLLKNKNKNKKTKFRSTSRDKAQNNITMTQVQTKLPFKSLKAKENKRNKQGQYKQEQTSLSYPYEEEGYNLKQKRLKDAKLKLMQKLMKLQAEKMKLKNEYFKIEKRLMKNYKISEEYDNSDWEEGSYVIYHRENEKIEKQQFKTEDLTNIMLHKNLQCEVISKKRRIQSKEEISCGNDNLNKN